MAHRAASRRPSRPRARFTSRRDWPILQETRKNSWPHRDPARGREQVVVHERTPDPSVGADSEEEALRFALQRIEVLPVPVFYKSRDGRYLGVNQSWEAFFGVSRDDFVGKEVHDLYPQSPAVADKHYAMDQELWRNGGSQNYEIPIVTRDGRIRHTIYYKATFSDRDGRIAG